MEIGTRYLGHSDWSIQDALLELAIQSERLRFVSGDVDESPKYADQ